MSDSILKFFRLNHRPFTVQVKLLGNWLFKFRRHHVDGQRVKEEWLGPNTVEGRRLTLTTLRPRTCRWDKNSIKLTNLTIDSCQSPDKLGDGPALNPSLVEYPESLWESWDPWPSDPRGKLSCRVESSHNLGLDWRPCSWTDFCICNRVTSSKGFWRCLAEKSEWSSAWL